MTTNLWVILLTFALFLTASAAWGTDTANLAGTWNMTFVNATRGRNKVLTLKQKSDALEGTLKDEGGELTVTGKVTGNSFHLEAHKVVTIELDGTVDGDNKDKLSGTFKVLTVNKKWTAERQK